MESLSASKRSFPVAFSCPPYPLLVETTAETAISPRAVKTPGTTPAKNKEPTDNPPVTPITTIVKLGGINEAKVPQQPSKAALNSAAYPSSFIEGIMIEPTAAVAPPTPPDPT